MNSIRTRITGLVSRSAQFANKKSLGNLILEIFLIALSIFLGMKADEIVSDKIQKKSAQSIEKVYIKNIINDLDTSLNDINRDLANHRLMLIQTIKIYREFVEGHCHNDTLIWESLITDFQFYPNTSAYENLKNVGLEIILNPTLRMDVVNLFELDFNRIVSMGKENGKVNDIKKYMEPFIQNNFKIDNNKIDKSINLECKYYNDIIDTSNAKVDLYKIVPKDRKKLYKDEEFKILLQKIYVIRKNKIKYYTGASQRIIDVQIKLREYLISNNRCENI